MTGSELAGFLAVCIVLAFVVDGGSRWQRARAAALDSGQTPSSGRGEGAMRGQPSAIPLDVRAIALLTLVTAFAAPGWGFMSMVLAVLGMDPPPVDDGGSWVVTWLLLASPLGLVSFVQLLRTGLALLRADPAAVVRARRAIWAPGFAFLGMACVMVRVVAQGGPWKWSLIDLVVLGGPVIALVVALAARRIALRG